MGCWDNSCGHHGAGQQYESLSLQYFERTLSGHHECIIVMERLISENLKSCDNESSSVISRLPGEKSDPDIRQKTTSDFNVQKRTLDQMEIQAANPRRVFTGPSGFESRSNLPHSFSSQAVRYILIFYHISYQGEYVTKSTDQWVFRQLLNYARRLIQLLENVSCSQMGPKTNKEELLMLLPQIHTLHHLTYSLHQVRSCGCVGIGCKSSPLLKCSSLASACQT